jgi:signal transduction histidine kinase
MLSSPSDQVHRDVELACRQKEPHTFFFRTNKPWTAPDGSRLPTCLLTTAMTEQNEDGSVSAVLATMTDVTQLRWAEDIQKIRVQEVLESKRQQENFIDMTSHEMRNPLSAMVQCADIISSSLYDMSDIAHGDSFSLDFQDQKKLKDLINNSQDAVETIQACATHQKRIVDDILTMSKLDSKLLIISPIVAQPSVLLQDTFKMFKDEANKAGVELKVFTEQSYSDLNVDWAILDPSRVLQVLINLITNAIKFTKDQNIRQVEISMGASSISEKRKPFEYVPQASARNDFLNEHYWGSSEVVYLHFTVRDTGCGLTPEHKAKLFMRFSQATPKTHVQVCSAFAADLTVC